MNKRLYIEKISFAEAYKAALAHLIDSPEYVCSPRNYKINECLDATLVITDITQNLFSNKIRSVPLNYIKQEIALYLAGVNDSESFEKASKFWSRVKNDDGTVNSAYGKLIFNTPLKDGRSQFDWAFDSLAADKDSRQAIIFFNRPDFQYKENKDFVCTFYMHFFIRENKLFAKINMRSNDIFRGTISDIPFFTLVQYLMFLKLKSIYPELELGSYTHNANSLHIYYDICKKSDIDICKEMLNNEFVSEKMVLPKTANIIMSDEIKEYVKTGIMNVDKDNPDYEFYSYLSERN